MDGNNIMDNLNHNQQSFDENNIVDNLNYNQQSLDENINDGYDSNDEIKIEVTDYKNGNPYTHIYTVPFKPTHCNEKRLICFSTINGEKCSYGLNCTYAHSFNEQVIDEEKSFIYQIILDKNLMNFFSMTNPKTDEIYKQLLFMTHVCDNCSINKCTGGYNCRNGVCDVSLKLCKNDLLTGECLNKIVDLVVNESTINKLKTNNFESCTVYKGCINGHHLTQRNLTPYYKYIHKKENSKKNKYQSVRYIDINPLNRVFRTDNEYEKYNYNNKSDNESDSSTDEEINSWFQKKNDSDNENWVEYNNVDNNNNNSNNDTNNSDKDCNN
jgi:hypothetical protein